MLQSSQRNETREENNVIMRKTNIKSDTVEQKLTSTFKALLVETPQHATTMLTECGALVVIEFEAMWHINLKALFLELQIEIG